MMPLHIKNQCSHFILAKSPPTTILARRNIQRAQMIPAENKKRGHILNEGKILINRITNIRLIPPLRKFEQLPPL